MRRQSAAGSQPLFDRFTRGEELHDGAHFGAVIEHRHDVASHQVGLAALGIDGRQVEEVIIHASLGFRREEAGDEVALAVQPALGRVLEHRRRCITKEGGHNGRRTTVHIGVVLPDLTQYLRGALHFRRTEGQFTTRPLVIVLGRCRAQQDIFDPVRRRPTRRRTTLDAHTPSRITIIGDLLRQGHHLFPGRRYGVTGGIEVILRIPYLALGIEAVPHTTHDRAIRTLHLRHVQPALRILPLQVVFTQEAEHIHNLALLGKVRQQARLREIYDIRCIPCFYTDRNRGFEFLRTFILDIDAARLFKGLHGIVELHCIFIGERACHRYDSALEFPSIGSRYIFTFCSRSRRFFRLGSRFRLGGCFRCGRRFRFYRRRGWGCLHAGADKHGEDHQCCQQRPKGFSMHSYFSFSIHLQTQMGYWR